MMLISDKICIITFTILLLKNALTVVFNINKSREPLALFVILTTYVFDDEIKLNLGFRKDDDQYIRQLLCSP